MNVKSLFKSLVCRLVGRGRNRLRAMGGSDTAAWFPMRLLQLRHVRR